MADWFGEATKYFGKKKAGKDPTVEKMEEAIGVELVPMAPNTGGIKSPPTVPPVPPKKEKRSALMDRSMAGSEPFSDAELKQGYRKMGKGFRE